MYESHRSLQTRSRAQGSIFWGAAVMLVGGFLLSWIPFVGPFIAGVVGGKIAGTSGRGIVAALLPTVVVATVMLLVALLHGPFGLLAGVFAGAGLIVYAIFHGLALLFGAIVGGAL